MGFRVCVVMYGRKRGGNTMIMYLSHSCLELFKFFFSFPKESADSIVPSNKLYLVDSLYNWQYSDI